jgi:tetratricopeptide (TPR) repeat protein
MKKYLIGLIITMPFLAQTSWAQLDVKKEFSRASQAIKQKDYARASVSLFNVARSAKDANTKAKAKYYLGLSLYKLNLKQVAAYPFVDLVRSGSTQFRAKAIDHLLLIADSLDEPSLFRYALNKANPQELSEPTKALLYFEKGRAALQDGQYGQALGWYQKSLETDGNREETIYALAMAHLMNKQPDQAIPYFQRLFDKYAGNPVTSVKRGTALMGLARASYQAKRWKDAVDLYRQIPKDHVLYRQSLFELSWALFRNGQFRSALSPLQSLHTVYYENFYDPESLLLRGIILLFSCQYDDINIMFETFDGTYKPAFAMIQKWNQTTHTFMDYFDEINKAIETLQIYKKGNGNPPDMNLPFFIMRSIADESDVKSELAYMKRIDRERKNFQRIFGSRQGAQGLNSYGNSILQRRDQAAKLRVGEKAKKHLDEKTVEISSIMTQFDFLKYETLNGQREMMKKKISAEPTEAIDVELSRSFYIQNGYRYWPFQGEYWRDEIGNYQYLGGNRCE